MDLETCRHHLSVVASILAGVCLFVSLSQQNLVSTTSLQPWDLWVASGLIPP